MPERRFEMIDLRERLVAIESQCAAHEANIESQSEILIEIQKSVQVIALSLEKHKGFFGGIIFSVTGIWAVLLAAGDYILNHHS